MDSTSVSHGKDADAASRGEGGQIQSVQVMRGVAAAAVAFYHTHVILSRPEAGGNEALGAIAINGWLGVNFFFVLSGFIILFAHGRDLGRAAQLPRYLWRRFSRLYPIYWLCLLGYIVAAVIQFGKVEVDWSVSHVVSAFALAPVTDQPVLPLRVAWTLMYEVMFYAVFAVAILSARLGTVLLWVWAAAIIVRNTLYPPVIDISVLHVWNLYFLVGMGSCWLLKRLHSGFGLPFLIAGLVMLGVCGFTLSGGMAAASKQPMLLLATIAPFPFVLLGAILLERRYRWRANRWLMLLGDASYSIYLAHSAVLSLVALCVARWATELAGAPPLAVFLIAFALSVAAGVLVHVVVERPLLAGLRRLGRSSAWLGGPKAKPSVVGR